MTIIIQAVEAGGRSGGRNFPVIAFAGKKSPDLIFSNADRYGRNRLRFILINDFLSKMMKNTKSKHFVCFIFKTSKTLKV